MLIPRLRRSSSSTSGGGWQNQSISPRCRAAAAVAASGRVCHSIRSKWGSFGPAVSPAPPAGVGLYPAEGA